MFLALDILAESAKNALLTSPQHPISETVKKFLRGLKAYDQKAKELFGEFAQLNFP